MNVRADALATEYRTNETDKPSCDPHPFPGNPVQFTLLDDIVCSEHTQCIRYAASAPALAARMTEVFSWSDSVFRDIDWASHRKMICTVKTERPRLTKFLHEELPTMSNLGRGTTVATQCPRCAHPVEDINHVIRCSKAIAWRAPTMKKLSKNCRRVNANVDPVLEVLIKALESWLEQGDVYIHEFHPKWHALLHAQHRIGWDQVFRGRLSLEWRKYIHVDCLPSRRSALFHQETSDPWISTVCTTLVSSFFELWEQRNIARHKHSDRIELDVFKQRYRNILISLHRELPNIRFLDRDKIPFITQDPDDIQAIDAFVSASSRQDLHNWIEIYRPRIYKSKRLAATVSPDQPLIHQHFLVIHAPKQRRRANPFTSSSSSSRRHRPTLITSHFRPTSKRPPADPPLNPTVIRAAPSPPSTVLRQRGRSKSAHTAIRS